MTRPRSVAIRSRLHRGRVPARFVIRATFAQDFPGVRGRVRSRSGPARTARAGSPAGLHALETAAHETCSAGEARESLSAPGATGAVARRSCLGRAVTRGQPPPGHGGHRDERASSAGRRA
jgi:hypothetical protein